jgi:hypothetical protein
MLLPRMKLMSMLYRSCIDMIQARVVAMQKMHIWRRKHKNRSPLLFFHLRQSILYTSSTKMIEPLCPGDRIVKLLLLLPGRVSASVPVKRLIVLPYNTGPTVDCLGSSPSQPRIRTRDKLFKPQSRVSMTPIILLKELSRSSLLASFNTPVSRRRAIFPSFLFLNKHSVQLRPLPTPRARVNNQYCVIERPLQPCAPHKCSLLLFHLQIDLSLSLDHRLLGAPPPFGTYTSHGTRALANI